MAKAEAGRTYAVIQDGKAHWIFTKEQLPEWNDEMQVVDITGVQPQPLEGWDYDGTAFSPPATPVPDTTARAEEIRARLTQIDIDSVRPLRAIAAGAATDYDRDKLAALDAEADALRLELSSL